MNRRLLSIAGGLVLTFSTAGLALAQDTSTATTTTTVRQTVQNADGTYTIIEYPVGREVMVNLTPTTMIPGASGTAKITRMADKTMIDLNLTGLTGDATSYNVYAVDPAGKVTLLGPVTVSNGVGTLSTTTPLNRFMIVLSPQADLATYAPDTQVVLRSAVPTGFAVVPLSSSGERDGAAVAENVTATSTSGGTSGYRAPLLGIPGFRRGTDTELKINFAGALAGARANVYIEPRKDGPATIKMRFHELKEAPAGKIFVVWAVSPDNKFVKLGQIVNTGGRNEAQIQTETALRDFGLFVTLEDEQSTPTGTIVGTVIR